MLSPQNPVFQAAVAPFLASLVLVGAITLLAGARRSSFGICGAAIAIAIAYWLALSLPPFPPRAANHKLGYLIALSTLLSFLLANRSWPARFAPALAYLVVIAGLGWIAQSKIAQGQFLEVALVIGVALAAIVGLSLRRDEPVDNGVAVLVAAVAVAGIAFLAPSASLAQLSGAIAAATGGFLLWTWPRRRLDLSEAGLMAVAVPLVLVAGQASLYSRANDAALLVAAAIAFAPAIRAIIARSPALAADTLRPIATGVTAAIIAAAALAIAFINQTGQSAYGG